MFEPHSSWRLTDIVTGAETWISPFGFPPKRLNRIWIDEKGDRPVVLHPGFQSRKRRFNVFFNYNGSIVIDVMPKDTTMNSAYYVQKILPQMKNALDDKGLKREAYKDQHEERQIIRLIGHVEDATSGAIRSSIKYESHHQVRFLVRLRKSLEYSQREEQEHKNNLEE